MDKKGTTLQSTICHSKHKDTKDYGLFCFSIIRIMSYNVFNDFFYLWFHSMSLTSMIMDWVLLDQNETLNSITNLNDTTSLMVSPITRLIKTMDMRITKTRKISFVREEMSLSSPNSTSPRAIITILMNVFPRLSNGDSARSMWKVMVKANKATTYERRSSRMVRVTWKVMKMFFPTRGKIVSILMNCQEE